MTKSNRRIAARIALACLLLGGLTAAYQLGAGGVVERRARAEVRESEKPQAFKSGGARSEVVLREIAATLKQMDARLKKIEQAAVEWSEKNP